MSNSIVDILMERATEHAAAAKGNPPAEMRVTQREYDELRTYFGRIHHATHTGNDDPDKRPLFAGIRLDVQRDDPWGRVNLAPFGNPLDDARS